MVRWKSSSWTGQGAQHVVVEVPDRHRVADRGRGVGVAPVAEVDEQAALGLRVQLAHLVEQLGAGRALHPLRGEHHRQGLVLGAPRLDARPGVGGRGGAHDAVVPAVAPAQLAADVRQRAGVGIDDEDDRGGEDLGVVAHSGPRLNVIGSAPVADQRRPRVHLLADRSPLPAEPRRDGRLQRRQVRRRLLAHPRGGPGAQARLRRRAGRDRAGPARARPRVRVGADARRRPHAGRHRRGRHALVGAGRGVPAQRPRRPPPRRPAARRPRRSARSTRS